MAILFKNNASTKLASGITAAATTMSVVAGTGDLFPNPGVGDYFLCTLVDDLGNKEIVKVTERTADAFTIVRAQEGTTARAFNANSLVENRLTAGALNEVLNLTTATTLRTPRILTIGNTGKSFDGSADVAWSLDEIGGDASLTNYLPSGTGAVARTVQDKLREVVSVKDFGAVGDGVTDDTAAIQFALNTSIKKVVFPNGTYRVTSGLTSTTADREIVSDGGTILGDTNDIDILTVSGNRSVVRVNINGNNKARQGVVVTGSGCVIEGCDIRNLYGTTLGANGIRATTSGGVIVRDNRIVGINALSNTSLGDSPGACRAIFLNNTTDATSPSVIENNWCESITGEEGDAIQVLSFSGSGAFLKAYATIRNNTVKDFSRRGVKIQAHNVDVVSNTFISSLPAGALPNAVAVVDVIHSNDVNVSHNVMECGTEFIGIYGNGGLGAECNRLVFQGNVINTTSTTKAGVFLEYARASSICNNTISGGHDAIAAQYSTSCEIVENKFTGGTGADADILVFSSCQEFVIANNTAMAGTRSRFVENYARDALVYGNTNIRSSTFNGITVSPAPTYDRSLTGTTAATILWTPYTMPAGVPTGTRIKGHILIRPTLSDSTSSIRVYVDDDQISGVVVPNGTTLAEITFEVVFTGPSSQRGWVTCRTSTGTFSSSYGTGAKSNAAELPIHVEVQNGSVNDTMFFTVAQYEVII